MAEVINQSKKSYNPFKMWGSYIGGLIILISLPFGGWILYGGILSTIGLCEGEFCSDSIFIAKVLATFIIILFGFLIGWLIHSLIRKFKTKNQ